MKNFDVFIAYNSNDSKIINSIYALLESNGTSCWIDTNQIRAGDDVLEEVRKGISQCENAIIFVGESGLGSFQGNLEVKTLINAFQKNKVKIIPVLLPNVVSLPRELDLVAHVKHVCIENLNDESFIKEITNGIYKDSNNLEKKPVNRPKLGLKSLEFIAPSDMVEERESFNSDMFSWPNLISQIKTGRTLLFVGPNFSKNGRNSSSQAIPSPKDIARGICSLANIQEEEDLDYATDYFLEHFKKTTLVNYLREKLLVHSVEEEVKGLLDAEWLRIYTTNYDNTIEYISRDVNKDGLDTTSAWTLPSSDSASRYECIHINGNIEELSEDELQKSFLLSDSSFTSSSFTKSYWYSIFKKDLDKCNAIIFLGCNFQDFRPIKVLFESNVYREKAFFFLDENALEKDKFSFKRYGYLVLGGIKNLIKEIQKPSKSELNQDFFTEAFTQYELKTQDIEVTDNDIWSFLTYGKLEQEYYEQSISAFQQKSYIITRSCFRGVVEDLDEDKTVIIYSDFGNGKTILIKQVSSYLALSGKNVFTLFDSEANYILDIEKIIQKYDNLVFIIDGYAIHQRVTEYLLQKRGEANFSLLLTERSDRHDYKRSQLVGQKLDFIEYNIDYLDEAEGDSFIDILNGIGAWGILSRNSNLRKKDMLRKEYQRKISLVLLGLLQSKQIKDRISEILTPLFENPKNKSTVFAMCLVGLMDLDARNSTISDVAENDQIYSEELLRNSSFQQLFGSYQASFKKQSSVIMVHLLHSQFKPAYITDRLLSIAEHFVEIRKTGFIEGEVFKNLMRFSFIEKILPDENKKNSLVKYYDTVKSRIPSLTNNPHYWLQYAMARMTYKDLHKAETYLDTAYGIAERMQDYSTDYLDTQKARLCLLKANREQDPQSSFELFEQAHRLLIPLESDIHTFRQVITYQEVYEQKFKVFSRKNQVNFEHACKSMLANIKRAASYHDDPVMKKCEGSLNQVISSIQSERS